MSAPRNALAVTTEITSLFRAEFEMCNVGPGQTVMVFTDPGARPEYVAASLTACHTLGADVFQVMLPSVPAASSGSAGAVVSRAEPKGPVLDMMKQVDVVIDVSIGGMLHSEMLGDVLAAGTRMLRIREPIACLQRLFPTQAVTERVRAGKERMTKGRQLHVRSDAGSDLTVGKGERPVFAQCGFAGSKGQWDHWSTALVTVAPLEDSAEGTLVLAPGDILFYTASLGRYVTQPVKLTVRNGRIVAIDGGHEAAIIRDILGRTGEPDSYAISHIGWGCDHRADWNALDLFGAEGGGGTHIRSYYGGIVIAFGSNLDMYGCNRTRVHMDLAMRGASFALDGDWILDHGRFTVDDLK